MAKYDVQRPFRDYCHGKVININQTVKRFLSMKLMISRFVIPDANIKTKDTGSVIRKISSKLFGENNLKNHSYDFISTNPLALFCKENKQAFQGTEIDGYAAHFCNKTQKIQADVGKCIASNSTGCPRPFFK